MYEIMLLIFLLLYLCMCAHIIFFRNGGMQLQFSERVFAQFIYSYFTMLFGHHMRFCPVYELLLNFSLKLSLLKFLTTCINYTSAVNSQLLVKQKVADFVLALTDCDVVIREYYSGAGLCVGVVTFRSVIDLMTLLLFLQVLANVLLQKDYRKPFQSSVKWFMVRL